MAGATTVTFSGLTTANGNYSITAPTQAATITAKPLTVTGLSVPASKVYDGTGPRRRRAGRRRCWRRRPSPSGRAGTASLTRATRCCPWGRRRASYNSATVAGATTVTFNGLSTANGNYSITAPTYAATITRKGLTVTGITASSKVYDGTPAATLNTGSAALSGNLDGGNVTLSTGGASGAFADASVANGKTVTVSGLSISGAASGNYTLTQPTTTANITGKTLTVAATGPGKTYGTALTTGTSTGNFSAGATGVGSESVTSVTLTPDTAGGSASTAAGMAYTVTPSLATGTGGFSAANYNITYTPYNGTVGQAALTVTATGPAKTYGTALTTGTSSGNFTASATQNGETVTSVTLTPNAAGLSATTAAGLGYTVTPSLATGTGGFSAANYNIAYNAFSGTVGQAALTVTAAANTKQYDGTTSAAATPTGNALQNGDVITSGESYDNANVGTTHVLTPATVVIKNSGLTVDETANYNISTATINTGVIQQRPITVTAAANSKQYDGTTSAAATPTGNALQNGDVITSGESYDNANVGTTHVLTPATVVIKNSGLTVDETANYSITPATINTGIIQQRTITVTAAANTKQYDGTTSAAATPTGNALQNGDVITSGETYDNANVGTTHVLTPAAVVIKNSGLTVDETANYGITTANSPATGVISQRAITVTAATNTKQYDRTTSAAATPTGNALQNGDVITSGESYDNANVGTTHVLTPATVVIKNSTQTVDETANYSITTANSPATGVISQRAITVTAVTDTKTADGNTSSTGVPTIAPALAAGDTSGFIQTFDTAAAGTGKTLTPSGSVNDGNSGNNYNVSFQAVTTGTINPAAANKLVFTTGPANTTAGSTMANVVVQIEDTYGNYVSQSGTAITLTLHGSTLHSGTNPRNTDATGKATFNDLVIRQAGSSLYFTAAAAGGLAGTSGNFNIAPLAASQLAFTTSPGGGTGGTAWDVQPVVTLQDQYGNTVTGTAQDVTLAIQDNAASGTLNGTLTVTLDTGTGVATFSGLSIDKAGTGYTLTATGSTVNTTAGDVVSSTFNITVGAAAQTRVETLADGSGTVVGAQDITAGTRSQFMRSQGMPGATLWTTRARLGR